MKEEIDKIEEAINTKADTFSLINNYGFTFNKNEYDYQITHRIMSYGCECDTWDLFDIYTQQFYYFDTLDELLHKLKEIVDVRAQ